MTKSRFWKMPMALVSAAFALALVFTACGGEDNGGGSGFLGATLNLSGQVYTVQQTDDYRPIFTRFGGHRTVFSDLPGGGTGTIIGGQLNFTFGRPATEHLVRIGDLFAGTEIDYFFDSFMVTPTNAGSFAAWWFHTATVGTTADGGIVRSHRTRTATYGSYENVMFMFVDRDVTIRGDRTIRSWDRDDDRRAYYYARAFNITLREGWNALHERQEWRETASYTSATASLSHAFPGSPVRWILNDWDRAYHSVEAEPLGQTLPGRSGVFGTRR